MQIHSGNSGSNQLRDSSSHVSDSRKLGIPKREVEREQQVVDRNTQIVCDGNVSTYDDSNNSISGLHAVWRERLVHFSPLSILRKVTIPFGVISTSFLFTNINKAKAASSWIFEKEGIATKMAKAKENGSSGGDGFFETWMTIGDSIVSAINWLKNLPENITQLSVNLLTKLYELLMMILQTPLFIFNNSYIKDTTMVFASSSIFIVSILTVIELIKRMLKKKHTDFKEIAHRWSLAVIGSGFAPFLFEQTFNLLNIATKAITKIGASEINAESMMTYMKMSGFNTILLIGFDLVLIAIMIPLFLQNGRRFFDLMCLSAITPLALTAWVFDDYRHLFHKWWHQVKSLGSVQLVYSVFICILGVFIFGTRNVIDPGGVFFRLLIGLGGLYRLANPPQFVKSRLDQGEDIVGMSKSMWKTAKNVWSTATLQPQRLILQKKQEGKVAQIASLRKQHKRRYVGDLL